MLMICGTPIGNLEDISLRVLRVLKEADVIAAEDTRRTLKLLTHYGIATPLTSYHAHNAAAKGEVLLQKLKQGKTVALVSDAGMPAISDPGEGLVRLCLDHGVPVSAAPGPAAVTAALALSGMAARRFVFEGFLPRGNKERQGLLAELAADTRTLVLYEAPHHLQKTLADLYGALGDRDVALLREMTKKFEEIQRFSLSEAVAHYGENTPRGEYVLVVAGASAAQISAERAQAFAGVPIERHMACYTDTGMDEKAAMKAVAKDRGVPKREIYAVYRNRNRST